MAEPADTRAGRIGLNFTLSDEQKAFREAAARFARERLATMSHEMALA